MHEAERLLTPISLETFLGEIYEREPLHVMRDGKDAFADVFLPTALDDVLLAGAREPELFALVHAGREELPLSAFTVQRPAPRPRVALRTPVRVVDAAAVARHVAAGYTLVAKDVGAFSPAVARFCAALGRDLDCYVQANAYRTPPLAQGLPTHHDTHDTIVLHIEGEKEWTIYDPLVELPLETQPLAGGVPPGANVHARVHLKPGDALYVPRGFPHEARGGESTTLHVTFALVPIRVIDVLDALVRVAAASDVALRRDARTAADADLLALVRAFTPEQVRAARELVRAEMARLRRL